MHLKSGSWTVNEIFYMVNHIDVLSRKESFDIALAIVACRLNRSASEVRRRYEQEKKKNHHIAV